MAFKRPRAAYEADQRHSSAPFALFGTPLPPADPDVRDDGSYVPVWKQEARDERGRKRFHGAFTGGFSAGYFNTVGSKEGWTPSTFVSSRTNRQKDAPNQAQQRREDFMDDEDLADAAEAEQIQMAASFAGLGGTGVDTLRQHRLIDLFRSDGDTAGIKLMKKMGWREGQGVGPKIRRAARLDMNSEGGSQATHWFAPENTSVITFVRKNDHKGLGYEGEDRLSRPASSKIDDNDDEDNDGFGTSSTFKTTKTKPVKGGFGMGVLNDTGSDDEDPYELGPKISYNRVMGGDKKKKRKPAPAGSTNPLLRDKPVYISKKAAAAAATASPQRKCHDGRLPLKGFVLSAEMGILTAIITPDARYLPPEIPQEWKPAKLASLEPSPHTYISTADAARRSTLDPKSRAALLGEAQLPGKSVFDYLTPAARERLVSATGNHQLPIARGEVPEGYALTEAEQDREIQSVIPKVDQETAMAALNRGSSGWMPYADDDDKRSRYRGYLELQAGIREGMPERRPKATKDDWIKELNEFANCARIFKPMSGMMASRFTSSSSTPTASSDANASSESLLSKPAPKAQDPAEEAAKVGMFGAMTRATADFFPTRLLCKRFGVRPPAHVQADAERKRDEANDDGSNVGPPAKNLDLVSQATVDDMLREAGGRNQHWDLTMREPRAPTQVVIDADRNEALEGERAGEAVFRAIFGDDDDDGEDDGASVTVTIRESLDERKAPTAIVTSLPDVDVNVDDDDLDRVCPPPPQYPLSEASSSSAASPHPPPFSALYGPGPSSSASPPPSTVDLKSRIASSAAASTTPDLAATRTPILTAPPPAASVPAYSPLGADVAAQFSPALAAAAAAVAASDTVVAETKAALPRDTKGEPSSRSSTKDDEFGPPPAYSEGSSPLQSFTYLMAAAGGAASIITQVQQHGAPPINTLGDVGADETITMDLRGTRFTLSRDELLTLPEFVLLSLFPNGLLPDSHMNSYAEGDAFQVDYDPASLQYMLDFFRNVAQTIPTGSDSPAASEAEAVHIEPMAGSAREMLQDRAGIIVLREDLDFYAIPPWADIDHPEMIEVKRAAGRALLEQDGIFSGLKKSDEAGTTEQHLIEMLTAGGFAHDDRWGHRANEPNKAVICSLALARLRTDMRGGGELGGNAIGMAQKLLLFWRKPARRCWWEGVELHNVDGVDGKLKVWIRRVWTLEMSVIGLR